MKSPVEFAKALIKRQGLENAHGIALRTLRLMEVVGVNGPGLGDEIELTEQTEVRNGKPVTTVITIVDDARRVKRLDKTLIFWKNVAGYTRKRQSDYKAA